MVSSCGSDRRGDDSDSDENSPVIDITDLWVHKPQYLDKTRRNDERNTSSEDSGQMPRRRRFLIPAAFSLLCGGGETSKLWRKPSIPPPPPTTTTTISLLASPEATPPHLHCAMIPQSTEGSFNRPPATANPIGRCLLCATKTPMPRRGRG
nr:uncharacterized protein LOC109157187 [Ipomoea batatas]